MIERYIKVRNDFTGYHRYAQAPEDVAFLRAWHRHHFLVASEIPVEHNERDIEFFELQNEVQQWVEANYMSAPRECASYLPGVWIQSCETFAEQLAMYLKDKFGVCYARVTVSEDGECEATIVYRRDAE